MAGITLEQAEAKLTLWLAAEEKLATSQSYTIGEGDSRRTLTRADLAEVRRAVEYWDQKVKELTRDARGRGRTRYAVLPR